MSQEENKVYMAQLIFFNSVENSRYNRELLAKVALALGELDEGVEIKLSKLFVSLEWDEYQNMMSMLALRANTKIHWSEDDLIHLRNWAGFN